MSNPRLRRSCQTYLFTFQILSLLLKDLNAPAGHTDGVLLVGQLVLGVLQFNLEVVDRLEKVLWGTVRWNTSNGIAHLVLSCCTG